MITSNSTYKPVAMLSKNIINTDRKNMKNLLQVVREEPKLLRNYAYSMLRTRERIPDLFTQGNTLATEVG